MSAPPDARSTAATSRLGLVAPLALAIVAGAFGTGCPERSKRDDAKPDEPKVEAEATSKKPKKPTSPEPEPDACVAGAQPPTWTIKKLTGKTPKVELSYPVFESKCALVAQDLNKPFEDAAKAEKAGFEKEYREAAADPASLNLDAWELTDECKPAHVSAKIVSVRCSSSSYSGGAHGIHGTLGLTFLIEGRKVREVKLDELFDGERWRKKLSARVNKQITAKRSGYGVPPYSDDDVGKQLGIFVLEDAAVVFYFPVYSLGSYAEGEYEASIDYADLLDITAKEGPLTKVPRRK
jgi:hypothetical protein